MSNSSNLNGPSPISPFSGGIWKVRKNSRTDDRKNPDRDKSYKDTEGREEKDIIEIKELNRGESSANHEIEQEKPEQDADIKERQNPHKVDLVI